MIFAQKSRHFFGDSLNIYYKSGQHQRQTPFSSAFWFCGLRFHIIICPKIFCIQGKKEFGSKKVLGKKSSHQTKFGILYTKIFDKLGQLHSQVHFGFVDFGE